MVTAKPWEVMESLAGEGRVLEQQAVTGAGRRVLGMEALEGGQTVFCL